MKPRVLVLSALVIALGPFSGASAQNAASRAVPSTIPTVSLNSVARQSCRLNLNIRTAPNLEEIFTAAAVKGSLPQAKKQ